MPSAMPTWEASDALVALLSSPLKVSGDTPIRFMQLFRSSFRMFDRMLDGMFDGMFNGMFDGMLDGIIGGMPSL